MTLSGFSTHHSFQPTLFDPIGEIQRVNL